MAVDYKHPEFFDRWDEWVMLRDCARGAREVQQIKRDVYLPQPLGFQSQPDKGKALYDAYLLRAQFPEIVEQTVTGMVGLVHDKDPEIEMPKQMEYIWEKATWDGQPLDVFHRRMTREILLMGRYGVMTDVNPLGGMPYLTGYPAESIINWNRWRSLFVLDETRYVQGMDEFSQIIRPQFRALRYINQAQEDLETPTAFAPRLTGPPGYSQQVFDYNYTGGDIYTPSVVGGTSAAGSPFDQIPFVIAGPRDLDVTPDNSPMIGIARVALALYRLDADYRHQLYMSGQETMVCINVPLEQRPKFVGAGVVLCVDAGGDIKYVGPTGRGIEAHRQAIQDEHSHAVALGAQLLEERKKGGIESAEALGLRLASKSANLKTIALSSSAALERSLRNIAIFMRLDPNAVTVTANTDFAPKEMSPADAVALMKLWIGEAISYDTFYTKMQKGGIANVEREPEVEQAMIDANPPSFTGTLSSTGKASFDITANPSDPTSKPLPPPTPAPKLPPMKLVPGGKKGA
jgi:hypothetical protein